MSFSLHMRFFACHFFPLSLLRVYLCIVRGSNYIQLQSKGSHYRIHVSIRAYENSYSPKYKYKCTPIFSNSNVCCRLKRYNERTLFVCHMQQRSYSISLASFFSLLLLLLLLLILFFSSLSLCRPFAQS